MDYNEACKLLNGEEGGLAEWNRRRLAEWNRRRLAEWNRRQSAGEEIPSPSPTVEEIPTLERARLHKADLGGAILVAAILDGANRRGWMGVASSRGGRGWSAVR
jgi:uncharacterized protein YjbI with pentapeptide repeats